MDIIAFLDTGATVSLISERLSKKKLKGLNIWPFTGITSTVAYSTESTEVAVATMNFLLRDANWGLIAGFNPICLGYSWKNWFLQHYFIGWYQIYSVTRKKLQKKIKKKKEIVILRMQKLSDIQNDPEANGFCFENQAGNETMEPPGLMQNTKGSKKTGAV